MGMLKYSIGSVLASTTLFLAPAVPVAAEGHGGDTNSNNTTVTTTNTETKTINVGQCSVRFDDIKVWLDQYNKINNDDQNSQNENELEDELDDENTVNQDNSSSQDQSGSQANSQSVVITVSPDCSVTNVTQAAADEDDGEVLGAQAEAAKGGVGAGFGAASSLSAAVGAFGSVLGAGFGIRRFFS
ncbi:hypothetical protein HYU82_03455 [Candidatus Saccharibacteria bacterium]|nr:hypothetical protein [Candidatus Saccharibacteria bacterium]